MEKVQVKFVGMEPTDALIKYSKEKIYKYTSRLNTATKIEIFLKENQYRRGKDKDFRVDINVHLPNAQVRVEVVGPEMYANIDEATDTLARRLKRYHDKQDLWEGETPWKVIEADTELKDMEEGMHADTDVYDNYEPEIAVRKKLEDMSPMEEAEAIEKMELSGFNQMMFRSKNTGLISMVYRRIDGTYGLVEQSEGI